MYKATATLTDGAKQWDVVIFSAYESMEAALAGVKAFGSHGYDIVRIQIDKEEAKGCGLCKFEQKLSRYEPCKSCESWSNFEKKEESPCATT